SMLLCSLPLAAGANLTIAPGVVADVCAGGPLLLYDATLRVAGTLRVPGVQLHGGELLEIVNGGTLEATAGTTTMVQPLRVAAAGTGRVSGARLVVTDGNLPDNFDLGSGELSGGRWQVSGGGQLELHSDQVEHLRLVDGARLDVGSATTLPLSVD